MILDAKSVIMFMNMEIIGGRYNPGKYNIKPSKPKPSKGRVVSMSLLVIFCIAFSGYIFLASRWKPVGLTYEAKNFNYYATSEANIDWPAEGLSAVGDASDGVYLIKDDKDTVAPIASMAKVITALVVLDKAPMSIGESGFEYTITEADVLLYHQYVAKLGSVMPVSAGQKISQYDLLQGLLLISGNNVADYLAQEVFGSVEQYASYANEFVQSRGLVATHIDDSSGFSELTVSKPSEMITIGRLALQNPVIAEIVSKKQVDISGVGQLTNTNRLLAEDGYIGIKTGNTDQAGKCLLFAIKHGPNSERTLIMVIMGQSNWDTTYATAKSMAQSAIGNFGEMELVPAYATVANINSRWGQSGVATITDSVSIYGWKSKNYTAQVDIQLPTNLKKGDVVGSVSSELGSSSVEAVLDRNIAGPSLWWKLANYWREIK